MLPENELKEAIRARYGAVAKAAGKGNRGTCGAPGSSCSDCCSSTASSFPEGDYEPAELAQLPPAAVAAALGCGNPGALGRLSPGDVVLDLGSGGGIDVLLAARRVGPSGKVYGLDMTDEMLELARRNQREAGIENVEFLKGDIEEIPLPDNHVDVIISNCVVNLAADKDRVFREAFRVLKPGGRVAIADMMFDGNKAALPQQTLRFIELWAGCVAGALEKQEYQEKLRAAGFVDVAIEEIRAISLSGPSCCGASGDSGEAASDQDAGVRLTSGFVRAKKPSDGGSIP